MMYGFGWIYSEEDLKKISFGILREGLDKNSSFTRSLFSSTFKTNPWLERAIMTGITRVSKESIFSDLNNLEVVTTTSDKYAVSFGFTEEEVFAALKECGRSDEKEQVKKWYDGFCFGEYRDIYNLWSMLNFLDKGVFTTYWANTSSNSLVGKLLREGRRTIKEKFETLLRGETIAAQLIAHGIPKERIRSYGFAFQGKQVLIG